MPLISAASSADARCDSPISVAGPSPSRPSSNSAATACDPVSRVPGKRDRQKVGHALLRKFDDVGRILLDPARDEFVDDGARHRARDAVLIRSAI